LEAAEGETIKFLDSDDYLYPGVLEDQFETLMETDADVCYGPINIVDENGNAFGYKPNPVVDDLLGGIAEGAVTTYPHVFLYRAEVARREEWRTEIPFHQDTAYALDVASHAPRLARSDATVGVHRAHEGTRVTTTVKAESSIQNIRYKARLLYRAYERRKHWAGMNRRVRRSVALGLWRQAHKLAPADFSLFQKWWQRIQGMEPDFEPPRSNQLLRILDRSLGPQVVERTINPVRVLRLKFGARE
jgi:glycosyltransferase involved in cell wall biosynthesis